MKTWQSPFHIKDKYSLQVFSIKILFIHKFCLTSIFLFWQGLSFLRSFLFVTHWDSLLILEKVAKNQNYDNIKIFLCRFFILDIQNFIYFQVSWIRSRDLTILTIGKLNYQSFRLRHFLWYYKRANKMMPSSIAKILRLDTQTNIIIIWAIARWILRINLFEIWAKIRNMPVIG